MLDFIARHAICRQDRNATALIWAVAFGQLVGAPIVPHHGRRTATGSAVVVEICTRAGQITVCSRSARDGWSLLRFKMFWRLAIAHIDAWQVAVFIARRAESVDT